MTVQPLKQIQYRDTYDTDMEGIRQLFGEKPKEKYIIESKFLALIAPRMDGISKYQHTFEALSETIGNEINEHGSSHPFDYRFRQVPAKVLMNSNGQIIIITKYGSEIIIGGSTNDKSGYIAINRYRKNE